MPNRQRDPFSRSHEFITNFDRVISKQSQIRYIRVNDII